MVEQFLNSPRWLKKIIFVLHDAFVIFSVFWLTLSLRLPIKQEWEDTANWYILTGTVSISLIVFIRLGLYRAIIRYAGSKILKIVFIGGSVSAFSMLVISFYLHIPFPRSVPIMYFLLLIVLLTGSRFTIKGLLQSRTKSTKHPVIIYGAGDSGRQLLESIKHVDDYCPVAFVDDDVKLHKTIIHDISVYSPKELGMLINNYQVEFILLAIPSASQTQRKSIITRLEPFPCKILAMPGIKDLVEGKISVDTLKKISILDLLERELIAPDEQLIQQNISDKVVMVTGAGGSIGSELCRQIIQQKPKTLVLFELSEFALYSIEQELINYKRQHQLSVQIVPAMGSVQQMRRLAELMKHFNVDTVYHAAAYKHVPLVEYNTIEGVRNNIFGTLHCAQAAIEAKVKTFVLISTDKAVRPTNTMGATKRVAELVLQALTEQKNHQTCFCMVRFGNVLGSSGSVIPLFERQIASGGPITITHPEITRFFMTIPEAAQLVIQAGAMGEGGDVFLLDMGNPVKILDLAKKMVRLSGFEIKDELSQLGDIEIKVTGLRPGEKLYEELLVGADATGTAHPRIMTSKEKMLVWSEMKNLLDELESTCKAFNHCKVRELLCNAPIGFKPSDELCDIMYTSQ